MPRNNCVTEIVSYLLFKTREEVGRNFNLTYDSAVEYERQVTLYLFNIIDKRNTGNAEQKIELINEIISTIPNKLSSIFEFNLNKDDLEKYLNKIKTQAIARVDGTRVINDLGIDVTIP